MAANRPPHRNHEDPPHARRRREDRWDGRNIAPATVRRELARIAATPPRAYIRRAR